MIVCCWLATVPSLLAQTNILDDLTIWRYWSETTAPTADWTQWHYPADGWPVAAGHMGYGDGDETTVIDPQQIRPTTTYFRTTFFVEGEAYFAWQNLTMRMWVDDGAVVYLNGQELYRHNLPDGPINGQTPATQSVEGDAEDVYLQRWVFRGYLRNGTNVFAVEVHQAAGQNHDCSLQLQLIGDLPITPPTVRLLQPSPGDILPFGPIRLVPELMDLDGHFYRVDYFANGGKIAEVFSPPFELQWQPPLNNSRYHLHAVAIDNSGRRGLSETVPIQVGTVQQIKLQRGPYLQMGSPHAMTIRWRTDWFSEGCVRFGLSPDNLNQIVCDPGMRFDHEVRLTNLVPDTRYYYGIGSSEETLARGDSYYFNTSPVAARPLRIWVIGDSGTADEEASKVRDGYRAVTGAGRTDFWLMLGDNAYEEGTDTEYQAAVFDMYPEMLRQSVVWPTIGNHDASLLVAGQIPYLDIFTLPAQAEAGGLPSGTERYYSFDYGQVHLICLDSQTSDRSPQSAMWTWLEQDLAATTQDWIIAYWHHPPYSKGSHDSDRELQLIEMRERALPILEHYGVDLVLCGHSHVYERSYLLDGHYGYSSDLAPDMILDGTSGNPEQGHAYRKPLGMDGSRQGTVYAVCGCSGEGGGSTMPDHPAMFFSRLGYGSMILEVDGRRLDGRFIDHSGFTYDRFRIEKSEAQQQDGPRLSIGRAETSPGMILSWPETLRPFTLESLVPGADGATNFVWRPVAAPPTREEHRLWMEMPPSTNRQWFRLRSDP